MRAQALAALVVLAAIAAGCSAPQEPAPPTNVTASPTPTGSTGPTATATAAGPQPAPTVVAPTPPPPPPALTARAVPAARYVSPGENVSFAVVVATGHDETVEAAVRLGDAAPVTLLVHRENATLVTLRAPADLAAPMSLALTVEIDGDRTTWDDAARILPVAAGAPAFSGRGEMLYVLRDAATGRVLDANDERIMGLPLDFDETYHARPPVPLPIRPGGVITGVWDALQTMRENESRQIVLRPDQAYGNETFETRLPRDETLERNATFPLVVQTAPRPTFEQVATDSGELPPEGTWRAGDIVRILDHETGVRLRYEVVAVRDREIDYRFAPLEGDRFTFYEAWPNSTVAANVTRDEVLLRTTAGTAPGENLTWRDDWGNTTTVLSQNETHIVLRHSPASGAPWAGTGAYGEVVHGTVLRLEDAEVVIEQRSTHPLAGRSLMFDLTLTRAG